MMPFERATKRGRKFQAPVPTVVGGFSTVLKVLPLFLSNKAERVPRVALGPFVTDSAAYQVRSVSNLRVTWFGHSSLLLEIDGVNVLVDPIWDGRASPVSFAGPKRFFPPTIPLEQLPHLDAVLISHDHFDHLGSDTVRKLSRLRPGLRWIAPLAVGADLVRFGVAAACITELDWTDEVVVKGIEGAELRVTAVPARHFSGRAAWNRNETLWMALVLRGSRHSIYHGADTGAWPGFQTIAALYGPFDLCLLEIGAYNALWSDIHLGPDGAVDAFKALGGGTLMPIHWGLFDLALHGWREPIERVTELAEQQGIPLFSPIPGVPTDFVAGADLRSTWWHQS